MESTYQSVDLLNSDFLVKTNKVISLSHSGKQLNSIVVKMNQNALLRTFRHSTSCSVIYGPEFLCLLYREYLFMGFQIQVFDSHMFLGMYET